MKMNQIPINKNILSWAIARGGYDIDIYLRDNPRVKEWLLQTKNPTMKQLEDFSKHVHVPFGYLFLDTPPIEKSPIPFFRTVNHANHFDLNIYETIITLQNRQEWLSEYLKENQFDTLSYIGHYNLHDSVSTLVLAMRRLLNMDEKWAFEYSTPSLAINHFVHQMETMGCIIEFQSQVGAQNSRKISVENCRGFALSDCRAPFIFINNNDSKTAQMFTLAHEFVHLLIGFSAGLGNNEEQKESDAREIFCDKVAADFLVDETLLKDLWRTSPDLLFLAKRFKVSQIVIARRARDLSLITHEQFVTFYNQLKQIKFDNTIPRGEGGDFYRTAIKRIGYAFFSHIRNALYSNQLLYRDAYILTGIRGNTFNKLITEHL